jgi:hypothetical protein
MSYCETIPLDNTTALPDLLKGLDSFQLSVIAERMKSQLDSCHKVILIWSDDPTFLKLSSVAGKTYVKDSLSKYVELYLDKNPSPPGQSNEILVASSDLSNVLHNINIIVAYHPPASLPVIRSLCDLVLVNCDFRQDADDITLFSNGSCCIFRRLK